VSRNESGAGETAGTRHFSYIINISLSLILVPEPSDFEIGTIRNCDLSVQMTNEKFNDI